MDTVVHRTYTHDPCVCSYLTHTLLCGARASSPGHVSIVLDEDTLLEDIDLLRYAVNESNSSSSSGGGASGGASGGGGGSGYGGYDMSPGVSGRARRPPAWRREDA